VARSSTFACRPRFLEPGEGEDLACRSAVYTHPHRGSITELVAASRLSPPPLVHTRCSGKPPDSRDPCEIQHLRTPPPPARFVTSPREGSHFTPPRVIDGGRFTESLDGPAVGALAVLALFPGLSRDAASATTGRGALVESARVSSETLGDALSGSIWALAGRETPRDACAALNTKEHLVDSGEWDTRRAEIWRPWLATHLTCLCCADA